MPGLTYPIPHLPMLGKGSILIDIFDASGNPTKSYLHLGNCHKLEFDIKDDIAELYQSLNKSVSLIATALKKRQPGVAITGTDFSSDHMAVVQMAGVKTQLVQTVQTITAEAMLSATAKKIGRYGRTLNGNLDVSLPGNTVVHQGATTLVQGTDYVIADPLIGLIYFPASGAVVDTLAVTVDYKTLIGTRDQVAPGTQPYVKCALHFDPDPTDGQKIAVDIWRMNFNPSGPVGFIADDYGNWQLKGMILDDTANHPLSPYGLETFY
jgi:hypothetical protein